MTPKMILAILTFGVPSLGNGVPIVEGSLYPFFPNNIGQRG
jgi:hypothetical protein